MQLVTSGPDVPEALLQAHEEGRVVFFCGAGISYPAGLPLFKGLVDQIYEKVGEQKNDIEQRAYCNAEYDTTLDLLERRLHGKSNPIRTALAKILITDPEKVGATDTHKALLKLALDSNGTTRLVTTNFDRLFEHVIHQQASSVASYCAPLLPVPKTNRWNGLVYLHGLLPNKEPDESTLHNLVVTSGDFGRAYLTERWAARFVSELFRNYTVCFVGYGINDPVLRYMMDALAADRLLGGNTPQGYAFSDFKTGYENQQRLEWQAKGVQPILYEVAQESQDHSALHNTLKTWAETYRSGVSGKERIVMECAKNHPQGSTVQDNFVGRLLWAVSDESGLPARQFAEFNPAPSLDWLDVLSEERLGPDDLVRFGVSPQAVQANKKSSFSLMHRQAPYALAPQMLIAGKWEASRWDKVMHQLATWLTRHLDNPKLVLWIIERHSQLHPHFALLIEERLEKLAKLKREDKTQEIAAIREQAPSAIPREAMQTLWRLLLTRRAKVPDAFDNRLYSWINRFKRDGMSTSQRQELRDLLAPRVQLRAPYLPKTASVVSAENLRVKDLIEYDLVLATDNVRGTLEDIATSEPWNAVLPELLDDFQLLLRDALDLQREMSDADKHRDLAHYHLPSIHPHQQNTGHYDWVLLIEFLRDAWLKTYEVNPLQATHIAQSWWHKPDPTFKRLALFAASHDSAVPANEWIAWLTSEEAAWLWSTQTQRETMRLLVMQGKKVPQRTRSQLEKLILAGPPQSVFAFGSEPVSEAKRMVWLRLAKIASGGTVLGTKAQARLSSLSRENTDW
jgi:hypothetical protein